MDSITLMAEGVPQFMVKQESLEADATGIPTEFAVSTDDAMTGDDDGQGIVVIGAAHGTCRSGTPQTGRQFTIG